MKKICPTHCLRFVREVKKLDGSEYPPNTVRELVIMIQMHLHENSVFWKLLDQPQFLTLRNVVDNTMKERHCAGLGKRRSSDIISLDHENKLFNRGVLGDSSPEQLLKTVIYMVGMHCALRGGSEHSNLRRPECDSQITFDRDTSGRERLVYTEDPPQKTNQGGLFSKGMNKVVYIYGASKMSRCPIYLFKKYIGLLPQTKSCRKLYLRVRKVPTPNVWYCDQPYGLNKLKTVVKDICKAGGIEGHFTNHSLRATCASHLFDQNVPAQIIKAITGHKSDCVRVYKRTSDHLRESASKMVSGEMKEKRVKVETDSEECEAKSVKTEVTPKGGPLSYSQMVKNVLKTRCEMRKKTMGKCTMKAKRIVNKA